MRYRFSKSPHAELGGSDVTDVTRRARRPPATGISWSGSTNSWRVRWRSAAAQDEVSAAIAERFGGDARDYQALSAQAFVAAPLGSSWGSHRRFTRDDAKSPAA